MSITEEREQLPAIGGHENGLVVQPRQYTPPAILAEQQRAKSEIEAALTIAAARPRDEKMAMDRILIACQRPALAAKAQYQYKRGGTDITGPTIDLMEVVAQHWGNLEFGFRELARFQGDGTRPGESVVEAYAWDLETNTRRRTQFTVSHSEGTRSGLKVFRDPRDVYEWVSNQAQRRVRTALENIIPRDIVEAACEQCDQTLKANVDIRPEAIAKLVDAFGQFGVTKAQIEARLQRRIDSITPAQVVHLRKIWTGLRDGISKPDDWFKEDPSVKPEDQATPEQPKSKSDQLADKLKGRKKEKPQAPQEPQEGPQEAPETQDEAYSALTAMYHNARSAGQLDILDTEVVSHPLLSDEQKRVLGELSVRAREGIARSKQQQRGLLDGGQSEG